MSSPWSKATQKLGMMLFYWFIGIFSAGIISAFLGFYLAFPFYVVIPYMLFREDELMGQDSSDFRLFIWVFLYMTFWYFTVPFTVIGLVLNVVKDFAGRE